MASEKEGVLRLKEKQEEEAQKYDRPSKKSDKREPKFVQKQSKCDEMSVKSVFQFSFSYYCKDPTIKNQ